MPSYKLSYFNARGLAEVTRLMFAASDTPFEDERLEYGEPWQTFKPKTPYGQIPVLTVDGTMIHQAGAINRYIADQLGFSGKNRLEGAQIDAVVETLNDVYRELWQTLFHDRESDEAKKAELLKKVRESSMDKFFKHISGMLESNGGDFLVGSKLSMADIAVFDFIDYIKAILQMDIKEHKTLQEFYDKVAAVGGIAKHCKNRPVTKS